MTAVDLSEKLLVSAGGWPAMKQARSLCDRGCVTAARYSAPILQGSVREGSVEFRAGLKIVDSNHIENLCTCRASREWGTVCAHSIAVGLSLIRGPTAAVPGQSTSEKIPASVEQPATLASMSGISLALEGSINSLNAKLSSGPQPSVAAERQAAQRLAKWGFAGPNPCGEYVLKGERAILNFLAQEYPKLQRDWRVTLGERFDHLSNQIERIKPRVEIRGSGEQWFEMNVSLILPDGRTFSTSEIQRLLQTGQNYVRLKDNKIAVFESEMLDELQNALVDCQPEQPKPGVYHINRVHAGYIDAIVRDHSDQQCSQDWEEWTRTLLQTKRHVPLGTLENVLRAYQKEGVDWMNFLAENGFGGILADEMGLGKTLQALGFLRHSITRQTNKPALIICPSSLVYNWQRETQRFTPELSPLVVEGTDRQVLLEKMNKAGLVITSYPLLRRDIEHYKSVEFSVIILDEAQHIKNPDTQNALAATSLRANSRFVLTGTPMENSVRDIWSIMHFLMPGYLGSRSDFRDHYEQPIQRDNSEEAGRRLAKRLKPFMLRRLKRNVFTELPDKIEQVTYCELTQQQMTIYNGLLEQARREIHEIDSAKEKNKGRLLIFTALLRLRQACCDLRLLNLPDLDPEQTSGKLDMLDELLQEALDGGHRVLIFSQFVSMLALVKERLHALGTSFCYLDGQTKQRGAEVDRFQADESIPVFLISLKAGGAGLNLTAADTVIHLDPWWNPAVEAQATDRAHRIGQKQVVTSYKLITRNTVEEKILNLQRKKRKLIESTVESEDPVLSVLSTDELESLLQ